MPDNKKNRQKKTFFSNIVPYVKSIFYDDDESNLQLDDIINGLQLYSSPRKRKAYNYSTYKKGMSKEEYESLPTTTQCADFKILYLEILDIA